MKLPGIALALALACTPAMAQTNPGTSPLSVAKGGSGRASFTANLPVIGNGTGALALGTRSGNTTQFVTGTAPQTASTCVSFDASGNLTTVAGACETGTFTPANSSPSTQTIQAQLRKVPVTCEDYSGGCTAANIQAAIIYAANNNRCFMFKGDYTLTTSVVISTANGLTGTPCLMGNGSLVGPSSGTLDAVIEFKNFNGMIVEGNIKINCNSNAYISSGVKMWSDGVASVQFNVVGFGEYVNCRNAIQIGDVTQQTLPISEITIRGGFMYNVAQGVRVYSQQAVVNVIGMINIVDNTNWGSSFTGTCSGTTLTVASINSNGYLNQNDLLTGTGITAGTYIVGQSTGTLGGNGNYTVSQSCTSSSNSLTSKTQAFNYWTSGGNIVVNGGEVVNTVYSSGYLCQIDAIAGANAYGFVSFTGVLIEAGGGICRTNNINSASTPSPGAIQLTSSQGFVSSTTQDLISTDSAFTGMVLVSNNRFFGSSSRSGKNVGAANSGVNVYVDMQSFGTNMPQGYSGLSGGTQFLTVSAASAWTVYTPTVTAQTGTCTSCSATGQYYIIGKSITAKIDATVTTVGTAAGSMIVSLPFAATSNNFAGSGFEYQNTGRSGAFVIVPSVNGTSNMFGRAADGSTSFFANGNKVVAEITYELP